MTAGMIDMCEPIVINATPHDVNVMDDTGYIVARYPASTHPIRLTERKSPFGVMPVRRLRGGWYEVPIVLYRQHIAGPPPRQREGVYYIVSAMVAQAYPERDDFLTVDGTIRDRRGRVIGCTRLLTRRKT